MSNLYVWATINGSHLTRELTASPVITKWCNWELTLATNFGNHAQMVTKFGGQILATKFGFVLTNGPSETNFNNIWIKIPNFCFEEKAFENAVCKMAAILFRHQCVKSIWGSPCMWLASFHVQASFWVSTQPMRDYVTRVTSSLIGWAHLWHIWIMYLACFLSLMLQFDTSLFF